MYDGNEGIAHRLFTVLKEKEAASGETNSNADKNRDGQPLEDNFFSKLGFLPTQNQREGDCHNFTNECSQKHDEILSKNEKMEGVFFLGKQRENNEKVYKQMFAF